MKFSEHYSYPTDINAVFELISSQEFREEACVDQGATEQDVQVTESGGETTVRIKRTMPSDMPDFIRKLTGDTVKVVQTEVWGAPDASGSRTAKISVDIVGQPATMKGTARIFTSGEATSFDIDGDVKVALPFIGKKIEPEVAKAIKASLDHEVALGLQRL